MMVDENEDGRREYRDETIMAAVREHENPVARDVADAIGMTHRNVHYRLKQLEEKGLVESQSIGNTLVWTVVEQ